MKIVRIVLIVLFFVVAFVLIGGYAYYYDMTHGPLPQHSGVIPVAGLNEPVEIVRDDWAIPHIYATNAHDLFFAQGYTQAQDRWWQMEFFRHIGSGTIEELTGRSEDVFGNDVFIRTVGWRRVAEREYATLDGEPAVYLQAFADGVNAYISSRSGSDLALEYSVLGLTGINIDIAPWTPADTLVWGKVMAWDLGSNQSNEIFYSGLIEAVGEEMASDYQPPYPYDNPNRPTIMQPEDLPMSETSLPAETSSVGLTGVAIAYAGSISPDTAFAFSRSQNAGIGSNNWVVSGDLTESGLPLLADDPHLGIQMPSIWYEIGLHCQPVSEECPFNVVGFALPPAPAVIVGHNDHIAWGVTNFEGDVQDLYQIRVNPDNPLQYEWNGDWRDMTVYDEEIAFGDSDETVTIQVRETHFGPIINDNQIDEETGELLGFNNDNPLALRWTALDPGTLFKGVLELNRAANWSEFRQALSQWDVPAQNFIYADTEGNIGYQVPGRIPYRATDHDGTLPVPGWTDEYEWQGFVPYDLMPRIFNPERGYIVTANQAVAPLEYYDHLAAELGEGPNYNFGDGVWDFGYRGQRINQLIETSGPHSYETFRAIQGDNMNISAQEIVPLLSDLTLDGDIASARDWLLEWDFYNSRDSGQAAFYANFWERLMANLYDDQLHDGYEAPNGARIMWATYLLMQEPDNAWWDDAHTDAVVESRDDILIRSLTEGYANTTTQLGTDRTQWRWGALHTAIFRSNPLGYSGIDLIENMVNRGPAEVGGGDAIVNSTGWDTSNPTFEVDWLPSLRMIVSVGDFERSFAINTTGQSGHPFSSNYGDMIPQWAAVNYHPMIWSREAVDLSAEARLILRPES